MLLVNQYEAKAHSFSHVKSKMKGLDLTTCFYEDLLNSCIGPANVLQHRLWYILFKQGPKSMLHATVLTVLVIISGL